MIPVHFLYAILGRQRQANLGELKASPVHKVSSRTILRTVTQRKPVKKKENRKGKNKTKQNKHNNNNKLSQADVVSCKMS